MDAETDRSPRGVATSILRQFGITGPPVNPLDIATRLGFPVYWAEFKDPETLGAASVDHGRISITVNGNDPPNRRRFTVAHEIGHAVLHLQGARRAFFDDDRASSEYSAKDEEVVTLERREFHGYSPTKEQEANAFAASLMMPVEWVHERHSVTPDPAQLAEQFAVSVDAMKVRLKVLKLHV